MSEGPVCISRRQRNVHVMGETAAVLFVAPLLTAIAIEGKVTPPVRAALGVIVVGTLLIDGGLLMTYRRKRRNRRGR